MIVRHPSQDHHQDNISTSTGRASTPPAARAGAAQHARSHVEIKRSDREPWLSRLEGGEAIDRSEALMGDCAEFDVAQWYRVDEAAATRGRDITECWYG